MANNCRITLKVSLAWWLKLYLFGVAFVAEAACSEPDWEKVNRVIRWGVRVRVE